MSLSGFPNYGHDVGGFYGAAPDPELFVRWVQNGVFHPRFTIHSWNTDGTVNEPWMHPNVLPIIRNWIKVLDASGRLSREPLRNHLAAARPELKP